MDLLRRRRPEFLAAVLATAWTVVSWIDLHADDWALHRWNKSSALRIQSDALALGRPIDLDIDLSVPLARDVVADALLQGAVVCALALLGIALVRNGRRSFGLLVPAIIVILPLADTWTLMSSTVLLPHDPTGTVPGWWPATEGILLCVVVLAAPVAGALQRVSALQVTPTDCQRGVAAAAVTAVVVAVGAGLADPGFALGQTSALATGLTLALVVFATGLLVVLDSRRGTLGVLVGGVALLAIDQSTNGLFNSRMPASIYWPDLLGYGAALFVGPAVVLGWPLVARGWVRLLRRGPVLAPGA